MEGNSGRLLEDLYTRHSQSVLAYALRRVDEATAEEVVAETFVVVWRRLHVVPDPALPWLYGVARKLIANELRADRRRRALFERVAAGVGAGGLQQEERGLLDAVGRLSPGDREALLLVAWEGLSTAEVGVTLGCSPAAARARLHRARKRLLAEIPEQPPARCAAGSPKPTLGGETR